MENKTKPQDGLRRIGHCVVCGAIPWGQPCPHSKKNPTKTQAQHTPGPWEIVDQREMASDGHLMVVSPYDGSIADVTKGGGEASGLDALPNARLIAAAPDLANSLQVLVRLHPDMHEHGLEGAKCAWCDAVGALERAGLPQ